MFYDYSITMDVPTICFLCVFLNLSRNPSTVKRYTIYFSQYGPGS